MKTSAIHQTGDPCQIPWQPPTRRSLKPPLADTRYQILQIRSHRWWALSRGPWRMKKILENCCGKVFCAFCMSVVAGEGYPPMHPVSNDNRRCADLGGEGGECYYKPVREGSCGTAWMGWGSVAEVDLDEYMISLLRERQIWIIVVGHYARADGMFVWVDSKAMYAYHQMGYRRAFR